MSAFLEVIAETIARYRMVTPGQRLGVAVSGGADSVCLLHALVKLAPRWDLALSILHVNHRLRGAESDADEEFVRELGMRLGLAMHCHAAAVRGISEEEGDNLEQAARRVRRDFFLSFLKSGVVDRVALGHTRSDQAETVLFRFLRGSGTAGLAGMRPATPEGIIRPLIEIGRAEVEEYLRRSRVAWREDASNYDRAFARNRIRHDLLPALERDWNPALSETLAGMAQVARDEEAYWTGVVDALAPEVMVAKPPAVLIRADRLAAQPRAVARRLARRAVELAKGDLRGIDRPHIERILGLASAPASAGRFQAPGLDVFRSFEWVRLAPLGRERLESREYDVELLIPGKYHVPGTGWVISLEVVEGVSCLNGYNGKEGALDWGRISGSLRLRNWRPGDQYRPVGHASEAKIKTLFQGARVPLWDRRRWPVITSGEQIVWTARFGPAAEYAAGDGAPAVLIIREVGEST